MQVKFNWHNLLVFLILIPLFISSSSYAAENKVVRMNEVVQSYVTDKLFMGSVLVMQNGQVLLNKQYGDANLEWKIPNSPTTKFRIGSVTKQFTAASILLLEERGKLKINDPIKKYIPNTPPAWDKITIFNLLTHTSGIPDYAGFPNYNSDKVIPRTSEKLVAYFRDKPLDFQPGEKWQYSNSGYALLGYLIEIISGQSYKDFLEENIFKPLNMKDSGYDSNAAIILYRASGYAPGPNGLLNAPYIDMSNVVAVGGLYSTTLDLLKWEQGLFAGKILSSASLKKMITPFKNNYALGLEVQTVNGRLVISHAGGIEGFGTMLMYYPDDKLTIVVMSNIQGGTAYEIAEKLALVAHDEKVVLAPKRKEMIVSSKILEKYIGTYQLTSMFVIITLENGHLMAQAAPNMQVMNVPKVPLFAESETRFSTKGAEVRVDFFKNTQGVVTHLVLHQFGQDKNGEKIK